MLGTTRRAAVPTTERVSDTRSAADRLYWHILKNYEADRYLAFEFPEDSQFSLPSRPALPSNLLPLAHDTLEE